MAGRRFSARDLVTLAVLALLTEGPSHPYAMLRTMRERHWDFLTGLPRSVYHSVDRVTGAGWAEPVEVTREGQRPERTILRITGDGREELAAWLTELLSEPGPVEAFTAAVAFCHVLPDEARLAALGFRAARLAGQVAELDAQLNRVGDVLPKALLLDHDLRRMLRKAELDWVDETIAALRSGEVNWDFIAEES